jgi:hypothetical protein
MSGQGLSYDELRSQLASVKAAYDLSRSTWPAALTNDMTQDFDRAIRAWDLTLALWKLKVAGKYQPTEPDFNNYTTYHEGEFSKYLAFGIPGESDYLPPQIRGKRYVPYDLNISALLAVGHESFNGGRSRILTMLQ